MNLNSTTLNERKKAARSLNLLAACGIAAILICATTAAIISGPDKSRHQSVKSSQQ